MQTLRLASHKHSRTIAERGWDRGSERQNAASAGCGHARPSALTFGPSLHAGAAIVALRDVFRNPLLRIGACSALL
jgi:hypothetical protein